MVGRQGAIGEQAGRLFLAVAIAHNGAMGTDTSEDRIREYTAPGVVVTWESDRCQHSANCVRGLPQVFDTAARPWIDPTAASVEDIVATIDHCPSYALGYRTGDGRTRVAPPR